MKKLLLATTIIGASAGFAAAEITLSGDARMGILDDFGSATDATFTSRARVKFTLSGESDTGFSFGADFRADNAAAAASGTAGSVYISGAFGKLSMGDVDGAAQAAVGNVDGVGLTGLGDLNESYFLGAGGRQITTVVFGGIPSPTDPSQSVPLTGDPTALYEYSNGGLGLYASVTKPNYSVSTGIGTYEGMAYALGAAYTMGDYKLSLGYERLDFERVPPGGVDPYELDHVIVGADATFGAVTLKARYGSGNIDYAVSPGTPLYDFDQWAMSATYTQNGLSLTGYASNQHLTLPAGANSLEVSAMGLGASYDLGGGAKVVGGIARRGTTTGAAAEVTDNAADIGLSFSF
ncbi:MAG: porin [Paracoccaceae bacterium]